MSTLFVTNNTDLELVDGYNGVTYDFKKGVAVEIPMEVAKHIFGFEEDDKLPYLARLGWISSRKDLKKGLDLLDQIDIQRLPPRKNQSLSPLVDSVPLPSNKKGGGKVLQAVA
jgi:hypothetical protein